MIDSSRYIAFIGDSYCAGYAYTHWVSMGSHPQQQGHMIDSHPSLVADHYGYQLLPHGYNGQSWWYSRSRWLNQVEKQPGILDRLEAMVFFHTNAHRVNTQSSFVSTDNIRLEFDRWQNQNHQLTAHAQRQWVKYLMDTEFQNWAQDCWFREISRTYAEVKQLHFHCFENSLQYKESLMGCQFITPLVYITVGETTGTQEQSMQSLMDMTLPNHMSVQSNRVLAQTIIDSLDNYAHGMKEIDLQKFNLVNPNYENWPDKGKWWTQH